MKKFLYVIAGFSIVAIIVVVIIYLSTVFFNKKNDDINESVSMYSTEESISAIEVEETEESFSYSPVHDEEEYTDDYLDADETMYLKMVKQAANDNTELQSIIIPSVQAHEKEDNYLVIYVEGVSSPEVALYFENGVYSFYKIPVETIEESSLGEILENETEDQPVSSIVFATEEESYSTE